MGERGELIHEVEVGCDGERRLGAERLRADERPFEMRAEHSGLARPALGHRRADAGKCRKQLRSRRGDRGREQRRGAMARMEPCHAVHGIGARHAIGAVAAVHVQVDEARQHEPVLRRVRRGFDRLDGRGATQLAAYETLRRQDLAGDDGHGLAPNASRALIR